MLLDIDGMKCGGCVRAVERTLLDQPGVADASVNLVTRSAWLRLEGETPSELPQGLEGVLEALHNRGFPAKLRPSGLKGKTDTPEQAWGWWRQWRR